MVIVYVKPFSGDANFKGHKDFLCTFVDFVNFVNFVGDIYMLFIFRS